MEMTMSKSHAPPPLRVRTAERRIERTVDSSALWSVSLIETVGRAKVAVKAKKKKCKMWNTNNAEQNKTQRNKKQNKHNKQNNNAHQHKTKQKKQATQTSKQGRKQANQQTCKQANKNK